MKKLQEISDVIKILNVRPHEKPPFSYTINNLGIETCVIKVKKIACDSLKGRGINSGLRLVYAHFPDEQKIISSDPATLIALRFPSRNPHPPETNLAVVRKFPQHFGSYLR